MDKLGGLPHSKASLRLWLKLLSLTMVIEKRVRSGLENEFDTTLPRFDVMAALERSPDGLSMNELSRMLMVSNGNVTGVVARLVEDGLVQRITNVRDRRSVSVQLTRKGRSTFMAMAKAHEQWVEDMMSHLSDAQIESCMRLLRTVRSSVDESAFAPRAR
jgi:DNA-binding MarR family transcriptional regulator